MAGTPADEVEQGSTQNDVKTTNNADIPPEYFHKHPLQNTWTLWYYDSDKNKSWQDNLKQITSFDTVEDFWCLYNHIKFASELRIGCDYSLFKQGIQPMWEDQANKMGGRWLINVEKKLRSLDRCWLDVILLLIGGMFDNSDEVCGAVVQNRRNCDKIGVWTGDSSKQQATIEIGQKLKERLGISGILGYQPHRETMVKNSSKTKNIDGAVEILMSTFCIRKKIFNEKQ